MHIWGTLSSRTQINLSLLITTLLSSPTFLLQKSPSTIGIHIRQCSKGQCLMHTFVYIRHLPQGQCSRMAHRHLPERKMLKNMAHIGVHCTLHKMAMLKNGTYLCKLQLHVDMGSIIHFCTDTNTQNRTNFTKSLKHRIHYRKCKNFNLHPIQNLMNFSSPCIMAGFRAAVLAP